MSFLAWHINPSTDKDSAMRQRRQASEELKYLALDWKGFGISLHFCYSNYLAPPPHPHPPFTSFFLCVSYILSPHTQTQTLPLSVLSQTSLINPPHPEQSRIALSACLEWKGSPGAGRERAAREGRDGWSKGESRETAGGVTEWRKSSEEDRMVRDKDMKKPYR